MKFTQKLESIPFLLCPLFLSVEQNDSAIPENRFCDAREQILRYHRTDSARNFPGCTFLLRRFGGSNCLIFWGFNFVIIAKSGEDFG